MGIFTYTCQIDWVNLCECRTTTPYHPCKVYLPTWMAYEFPRRHESWNWWIGGFSPFEKILVKLDHFPMDRGENKKTLKPPPRKPFTRCHILFFCDEKTRRNEIQDSNQPGPIGAKRNRNYFWELSSLTVHIADSFDINKKMTVYIHTYINIYPPGNYHIPPGEKEKSSSDMPNIRAIC